jgi:peptidoglycan hydrolase-like protein with peptidoglycan-binding domain
MKILGNKYITLLILAVAVPTQGKTCALRSNLQLGLTSKVATAFLCPSSIFIPVDISLTYTPKGQRLIRINKITRTSIEDAEGTSDTADLFSGRTPTGMYVGQFAEVYPRGGAAGPPAMVLQHP